MTASSGTSAGLLLVFMAGIASAWARGLQIDCGCFSTGGAAAGVGAAQYLGAVLRDTGLLVLSLALVWRPWSRFALGGWSTAAPSASCSTRSPFIGPESTTAASAATCAGGQGKFWQYHDQLFAQQGPENSGTFSTSRLESIGRQVGLTGQRFTTCVDQGTYKSWIAQQTDAASQRGVNQTPTVLVDGQAVPDAITAQGLQAAVDAALAAK